LTKKTERKQDRDEEKKMENTILTKKKEVTKISTKKKESFKILFFSFINSHLCCYINILEQSDTKACWLTCILITLGERVLKQAYLYNKFFFVLQCII